MSDPSPHTPPRRPPRRPPRPASLIPLSLLERTTTSGSTHTDSEDSDGSTDAHSPLANHKNRRIKADGGRPSPMRRTSSFIGALENSGQTLRDGLIRQRTGSITSKQLPIGNRDPRSRRSSSSSSRSREEVAKALQTKGLLQGELPKRDENFRAPPPPQVEEKDLEPKGDFFSMSKWEQQHGSGRRATIYGRYV